jgi:regulation of enolase protein 1 (concanavalin A-like superfamily)
LSTSDLTNLASYISNIDDAILSAPAPLSVTLATPLLTVSSSFSVSATFSGPATGFTSSDIAVANGTLGTLTGSGATYTFTVTPTGIGTVTVSVGAGVALDTEGAPNLASNTLSLSYQLNRPPVIMAVGTQTTVRGQSANPVQIAASDPDGQPLSYSVTGLPSGLSISATGLISGTVSSSAASSNTVTVTVSDGSLTASTSFTWNTTAPQGLALTGRDIGTPGAAGSNSLTAGVYTVSGSGNDIWGSSDNFRFVSQSFAGDGEIIVRVTSQTSTDPWAKAGLMFRETLTAGSRHALVALTPGNGIAFQYRTTTAGSSGDAGSRPAAPAPNNWLRLTRRGDVFTGYQSTDGINWTTVGNVTIPMSAVINVGLCVTSHYDGLLSTAVFDNLQLGL